MDPTRITIRSRWTRVAIAVLAAALVAAGCGGGASDSRGEQGNRGAAKGAGKIELRPIGEWTTPVQLVAIPGSPQVAVVEQGGRIRVEDPAGSKGGDGAVLLDVTEAVVSGGEQGLLGLVFHPDWPRDDRIFVNYTARPEGDTRIVEYHLASPEAAAERPRELLRVDQPYSNHNGGALATADGLLYVGLGDGGSGGDPQDRAQDPDELLGKVLRIALDEPAAKPEVWAIGLRNPWRFSIDQETGLLWIGDVGQGAREEVDAIPTGGDGGNLGWDVREGSVAHDDAGPRGPGKLIEPVHDYGRDQGCSITGGVVYRGRKVPSLVGRYVFADFCADQVWTLDADAVDRAGAVTGDLDVGTLPGRERISSFGTDDGGELYVVSLDGAIYAVESA